MNPEQLKQLVNQPLWSKQVIVWMGEPARLDSILQGHAQRTVDVLELIPDDDSWPTDPEDRADWLRRRLDEAARELRPSGPQRLILRVRHAALLARLGVGLGPFFDW